MMLSSMLFLAQKNDASYIYIQTYRYVFNHQCATDLHTKKGNINAVIQYVCHCLLTFFKS